MGIRRYCCSSDATITNAFEANMLDRGDLSNSGLSDILEAFSIFGQASSASMEKSRILMQFPIDDIEDDRTDGLLPVSGSVSFYLRVFNAPHSETLPRNYTMLVKPVSSSWNEGRGLDMETYSDLAAVNWLSSSEDSAWSNEGGDFVEQAEYFYSQSFDIGNEDLSIDITNLVEDWIDGTIDDNGLGLMLSGTYEDGSLSSSFYTKRFFARGSEFYYKRPIIEARWDSSIRDDRGNFYASSSLAPVEDNTNIVYLYNVLRGQRKDLPGIGTGSVYVDFYPSVGSTSSINPTVITGGWVDTGIYSASVVLDTTASIVYDVWHNGVGTQFYTGSVTIKSVAASEYNINPTYVTKITNLKTSYSTQEENARFRVYVREKFWEPTIYTIASVDIENVIIDKMYYSIQRTKDDYRVVEYGTGSIEFTKLSYDSVGNYFDFDISLLEPGYAYAISFLYILNGTAHELSERFKFRVQE